MSRPRADVPVYLDMDPGIDDAYALFVALGQLDIAGLAAVAGNVELTKTWLNSRRLLKAIGRDVPVWWGSEAPLARPLHTAPQVHGSSGLDGWTSPASVADAEHRNIPWVEWPAQWRAANTHAHVIATGPLTNIAKLIQCTPDLDQWLTGITLMGGAIHSGNVTPTAEFNFYVDPEAADVVMQAPVPVRMVGLDVTHKARLPWDHLVRFQDFGDPGRILYQVLQWYGSHAERHPDGLAVHDAVAVAAYARPDLFAWRSWPLAVMTTPAMRGTVVRLPNTAERPQVEAAVDVDVPAVLDWLWAGMAGLSRNLADSR